MRQWEERRPRWSRAGAAVFLVALALAQFLPPDADVARVSGMQSSRNGERVESATPVAVGAKIGDPLDGEPPSFDPQFAGPLDGDINLDRQTGNDEDPGAPPGLVRFEIERSGRPNGAPRSDVVYDDEAATTWAPDSGVETSWLWLDVGDGRRLREVRWLISGKGEIDVAVSSDRERWKTVTTVGVESGWGGATLREDSRYLRLTLTADGDEPLPEIAEVAIYGREQKEQASLAQDAKGGGKGDRRGNRREKRERDRAQEAPQASSEEPASGSETRDENGETSSGNVSARKGETRCRGDRARCRAREGKVSVEEDCASNESCTIDVRADGGTAICDATGGEKNRAGDGEGRRVGGGGRCEAVADGGTVTIGDIDP